MLFWLFVAFLLSWAASEAFDVWQRQGHVEKMQSFMEAGARFTSEDGYRLCKRIQHLERQHHDMVTIEECRKPVTYDSQKHAK